MLAELFRNEKLEKQVKDLREEIARKTAINAELSRQIEAIDRTAAILQEMGVQKPSRIDVQNNVVQFHLREAEKEKLDAGLRTSGLKLPDGVEIVLQPLPEQA